MKRLLLTCVLVIVCSAFCRAQFTIGSVVKPVKGAILDLKQEDKKDGSANSEKGLGLPRVVLNHLIIPNGKTSLATTIDKASGEWNKEDHIGLVIFNVKPQVNDEICPVDPIVRENIPVGPYVWTGNEWQYLGTSLEASEIGRVEILIDERDQNEYPFRAFGDPNDPDNFAGYWTLENARYLDKTIIYFDVNKVDESSPKSRLYLYPNSNDEHTVETPPETWRENQGYLYTYSAATLGEQDDLWALEAESQGQESGPVETTPIIQGVCPPGWHVPTDREWNQLARVIFNNPDKYSSYAPSFGLDPSSVEWNSELEIEPESFQGVADENNGLGVAMLSSCSPLIIDNGEIVRTVSVGRSKTSLDGGFNALLTGGLLNIMGGVAADTYNLAAGFWTSSAIPQEGAAWGRAIEAANPQGILRTSGPAEGFYSVRCKRD